MVSINIVADDDPKKKDLLAMNTKRLPAT